MVRRIILVLLVALIPTVCSGEKRTVAEIGTKLGVTVFRFEGNTVTYFRIPGDGIAAQPSLYASFFVGRNIFIEPQMALSVISSEHETSTTLGLEAEAGYLFSGPEVRSGFVAAVLSRLSAWSHGESQSETAIGARLGYRFPLRSGMGLRLEGGYRRWMDPDYSDFDEFSFGVGIGSILHSGE